MLSIIYDDINDIKKLERSVRSFLNNVYDKSDIQFIFITEKFYLELKQLQIDCKFKIVNDTIENVVKNIDSDWFWNVSENFIILTKNFDRIFDYYDSGLIFCLNDDEKFPIINLKSLQSNGGNFTDSEIHKENYMRFDLEI